MILGKVATPRNSLTNSQKKSNALLRKSSFKCLGETARLRKDIKYFLEGEGIEIYSYKPNSYIKREFYDRDSEIFKEVDIESQEMYILKVPDKIMRGLLKNSNIPKLPKGFGFKGGAAREVLSQILDRGAREVRDLDVCSLANNDLFLVDEIGRSLMPEDYKNGYGVEQLKGTSYPMIANYLTTRDLTMNEVLLKGNWLYVSKSCLEDTFDRKIRISDYERSYYEDGTYYPNEKIFYKAIRMEALSHFRRDRWDFDMSDMIIPDERLFFKALQFDRALGKGVEVAAEYLDMIDEICKCPRDDNLPENKCENFIAYINNSDEVYNFYFQNEKVIEKYRERCQAFNERYDDDKYSTPRKEGMRRMHREENKHKKKR